MVGFFFLPRCFDMLIYNFFSLVAGEPKPYSQITDEDHELMTPEEYTAYFEIFQARSEG
jgi:hypothetical protein